MSNVSQKFERQIWRIHELIKQQGSKVTWNDHVPDPDNPQQPRQIDITIRRDNKLTLVECRIHKKKQDVKWIEELIGRRVSLKADAVIAVSASGFTEGAIAKAKSFGIILRDLLSLTEEEITTWGYKTHVWLTFNEYKNVHLTFIFESDFRGRITLEDIIYFLQTQSHELRSIFDVAADAIDKNNPKNLPCKFKANLHAKKLRISEAPVISIDFEADFQTVVHELDIPSVVVYDSPKLDALKRNVFVEAVELGDFEIVQSSNRVFVALDLSPISVPENCQFRIVNFDFNRTVTMEWLEILGVPEMGIKLKDVVVSLSFANTRP